MIHYCVQAVDARLQEKRSALDRTDIALDADRDSRDDFYSDEVKKNQIHNELTVESIIRQRSLAAFRSSSQCRFFVPPPGLEVPQDDLLPSINDHQRKSP